MTASRSGLPVEADYSPLVHAPVNLPPFEGGSPTYTQATRPPVDAESSDGGHTADLRRHGEAGDER